MHILIAKRITQFVILIAKMARVNVRGTSSLQNVNMNLARQDLQLYVNFPAQHCGKEC